MRLFLLYSYSRVFYASIPGVAERGGEHQRAQDPTSPGEDPPAEGDPPGAAHRPRRSVRLLLLHLPLGRLSTGTFVHWDAAAAGFLTAFVRFLFVLRFSSEEDDDDLDLNRSSAPLMSETEDDDSEISKKDVSLFSNPHLTFSRLIARPVVLM